MISLPRFRQPPPIAFYLAVLLLIALIVLVDYLTGPEVTIYPFYGIPILLTVWYGNIRKAVAISVLCTVAWWGVDRAVGHVYSSEWLRLWDATVRLMLFCLVLFAGWSVKRQRDIARARIELLERSHRLEEEIIGISEREQQRIGRDLHDGVCQYLAAIGFTASMLKRDLEKVSQNHASRLGEVASHLRDAVNRVRQLIRGLSPVDEDEGGLESALEELATTISKLTQVSCSFVCSGSVPNLENPRSTHLFRTAQEAVGNALKHARATSVIIALDGSGGSYSLRVSDDGIGMDPSLNERKGLGLGIMRYRARMIGGDLEIYPNSPTGTVVVCTIPMTAIEQPVGSGAVSHES
jgi:signal transduction histidine kinase